MSTLLTLCLTTSKGPSASTLSPSFLNRPRFSVRETGLQRTKYQGRSGGPTWRSRYRTFRGPRLSEPHSPVDTGKRRGGGAVSEGWEGPGVFPRGIPFGWTYGR